MITDGFDPGDDETGVAILGKWRGGALSTPLYTVLAGMLPQPTVECVVLRRGPSNDIEALLIPRPESDIAWKGMLHSPGAALRGADYRRADGRPVNGVFERVQRGELNTSFIGEPRFAGLVAYMTARGPEAMQCYLVHIEDDAPLPEGAGWYRVDDLPGMDNFIQHQLTPVRMAVMALLQEEAGI